MNKSVLFQGLLGTKTWVSFFGSNHATYRSLLAIKLLSLLFAFSALTGCSTALTRIGYDSAKVAYSPEKIENGCVVQSVYKAKELQSQGLQAWPITLVSDATGGHAITAFYKAGATYVYDCNSGIQKLCDGTEKDAQTIARKWTSDSRAIACWLPTGSNQQAKSVKSYSSTPAPIVANSSLVQSIYATQRLTAAKVPAWPISIQTEKGKNFSVTAFHLAGSTYVYDSHTGTKWVSSTLLMDPTQIATMWKPRTALTAAWLPKETLASF